jgi:hypothetical protein
MGRGKTIGKARAAIGIAVVLALAAIVLPSGAQPESDAIHYRRLDLLTPWGQQRVLIMFPRRPDRFEHPPGQRYPVLIALHGRAEAVEGPQRGYLGWASRYGLPDAFAALARGHLSGTNYHGFVRAVHLNYVNASLSVQPFRGVLVVTPYIPDVGSEALGSARMNELGDWLAGPLLSAVRRRFPGAAQTREGTGIDGVSLGGRVALEIGFRHPSAFGAVAGIQPAISGQETQLAELAATAARSGAQRIRLMTSDDDPYLWATRRLSNALVDRRLPHTLTVVPGPHGYDFNRGPGSVEMLLFHDRALAREPFPEEGSLPPPRPSPERRASSAVDGGVNVDVAGSTPTPPPEPPPSTPPTENEPPESPVTPE